MPDFTSLSALQGYPYLLVTGLALIVLAFVAYRAPTIIDSWAKYQAGVRDERRKRDDQLRDDLAKRDAQMKEIVESFKDVIKSLSDFTLASQREMNETIGRYQGLEHQADTLKADYDRLVEQVRYLQEDIRKKQKIIAEQGQRIKTLEEKLEKPKKTVRRPQPVKKGDGKK